MTKKKLHSLNIIPTFIPRGKGNNSNAGKMDLSYKIKEWGYIFSSKEEAEKYANEHEVDSSGFIRKRKR